MTKRIGPFAYIAKRFKALGDRALPVEALIEDAARAGYLDVWQYNREHISNALKLHGLEVANGTVRRLPEPGEHFEPIATNYSEFCKAARRVVDDADYPLEAPELIERAGIRQSAVPMATLRSYMRAVGIFYIPGAGYWKTPQFIDQSGRVVSKRSRSERVEALQSYFESHGWPIVGQDASRDTRGQVTSRFLTILARNSVPRVASIGSGLYVPADKGSDEWPIAPNVAAALLSLTPKDMIDDKDHLRLFRLGLWLQRRGMAKLKLSRTTRSGLRRQTMRMTLTEPCRQALSATAKQTPDAF